MPIISAASAKILSFSLGEIRAKFSAPRGGNNVAAVGRLNRPKKPRKAKFGGLLHCKLCLASLRGLVCFRIMEVQWGSRRSVSGWAWSAASVAVARLGHRRRRASDPIHVKVVVVTMFEAGEDTGDRPGEFQLWVEREHLDQILPLAAGYHHVRLNKDGVLGLLTGVGTARAAASVMALGTRPAFRFLEGLLDRRRNRRRRSGGCLAGLGRVGRPRGRWRPRV